MNLEQAAAALVDAGQLLHQRGWVPATSGNFSIRLGDGDLAITASGRHKGQLTPQDIMRLGADGVAKDDLKPSAESGLHVQLYQRDAGIQTVLHTHSVTAAVASMQDASALRFEGLEILKAFEGIETHEAAITIPIFDNRQDIGALAREVDQHMTAHGTGVAYLIRGHGLYAWARDMAGCLRQLEALEYLFEYDRLSRSR